MSAPALCLRVAEEDLARWRSRASVAGISLSEWIRDRVGDKPEGVERRMAAVAVRFPEDQFRELRAAARRAGLSMSEIVRQTVLAAEAAGEAPCS